MAKKKEMCKPMKDFIGTLTGRKLELYTAILEGNTSKKLAKAGFIGVAVKMAEQKINDIKTGDNGCKCK